ncbi:uncharacterized protein METZ01_LOCUS429467, partial [marine metagenome]
VIGGDDDDVDFLNLHDFLQSLDPVSHLDITEYHVAFSLIRIFQPAPLEGTVNLPLRKSNLVTEPILPGTGLLRVTGGYTHFEGAFQSTEIDQSLCHRVMERLSFTAKQNSDEEVVIGHQ